MEALTQSHTQRHGVTSLGESFAGIRAFLEAQLWAGQNIAECLDDCDADGKIKINHDGRDFSVHCPILNETCPHGRKLISMLHREAIESIPSAVPRRFREGVADARETVAVMEARRWQGNGSLYLYGETGTGKSFAAAWWIYNSVLQRLRQHWKEPYRWNDLTRIGARWFSAFAICAEKTNLYEASSAPLLVIDDLGCEPSSPLTKATLNELISIRYNEKRPTIITSNKNLELLEKDYLSRMYERIVHGGQGCMVFDAGDYNLRIAE